MASSIGTHFTSCFPCEQPLGVGTGVACVCVCVRVWSFSQGQASQTWMLKIFSIQFDELPQMYTYPYN